MIAREESHGLTQGNRLVVLVALIAVLALALPASATTTRTEFSATGQIVAIADNGESWESGSILHVRGYRPVVAMDIDTPGYPAFGFAYGTVNFNLNQDTGQGHVWGTSVFDLGDGGFDCTAQGDIRPASVPGGLLGEFETVCHGFGEYEGSQTRGTVTEYILSGTQTYEGVVFVPGDR
jgi:hypothetical protein